VKAIVESDQVIPLRDYGASENPDIIDYLIVDKTASERVLVDKPEPWEENVWTVIIRVEDEYYASGLNQT
jgi:hypothetical protein